jgi:hypothetical protein
MQGILAFGQAATVQPPQGQVGTAHRARDGLGMEPAIKGIAVFPPTGGTHGEGLHRSTGPVIGQAGDDRVAGAAVGTVREGVAVPAFSGCVCLFCAGPADRQVRGRHGPDVTSFIAGENPEPIGLGIFRQVDAGQVGHTGRRRDVRLERSQEGLQGCGTTLGLDGHTPGVIPDRPGETVGQGQAIDRRAETHALDHTLDLDAQAWHQLAAAFRTVRASARPASTQASQASMPSPVWADTCRI